MATLNMGLFLNSIKEKYAINTAEVEAGNYESLAKKSGVSIQRIQLLFERYKQIQNSDEISAETFLELSKLIRLFKKSQKIK